MKVKLGHQGRPHLRHLGVSGGQGADTHGGAALSGPGERTVLPGETPCLCALGTEALGGAGPATPATVASSLQHCDGACRPVWGSAGAPRGLRPAALDGSLPPGPQSHGLHPCWQKTAEAMGVGALEDRWAGTGAGKAWHFGGPLC